MSLKSLLLLFPKKISQWCIFLRLIHSPHISIITTSRCPKGLAHNAYQIFFLMPIHNLMLELWSYFLPMYKIISRSSASSIFRWWFLYWHSCSVLAGFLPLCLGISHIFFFCSPFSKSWIGRSLFEPNLSEIFSRLILILNVCLISGSNSYTFWYLHDT